MPLESKKLLNNNSYSEIHELYTCEGWKSLKRATAEERLISIPYTWEHKSYA